MKNEFANRQNMHLTVIRLIDTPEFEAAWKDQKPTAFTTRAAEFRPIVHALTDLIAEQQTATTGYAETRNARNRNSKPSPTNSARPSPTGLRKRPPGRFRPDRPLPQHLAGPARHRSHRQSPPPPRQTHRRPRREPRRTRRLRPDAADATVLAKETRRLRANHRRSLRRHFPPPRAHPSPSGPSSGKSACSSKRWTASSSASAAPSPAPPLQAPGKPPASSAT